MSVTQHSPGAARVADLVIAGVSKGGTTSLFSYLAQHPDVCPSDVKEVRYFTPLRYGEPLEPLSSYTRHFRHANGERFTMEATPGYLYGGRPLVRGMLQVSPEVRVIVSLRNPADRCWSWFNFVRSRARIPKNLPFEEYLQRCRALHDAGVDGSLEHQAYWGLGGGCYDRWVPDWFDELAGRLRIIFFDDIVRSPEETVRGLCEWLGLDTDVVPHLDFATENRTEQFRNRPAQQLALFVNRRAERFFREHPAVKRRLRGAYYAVNRDAAITTLPEACRTIMDDFYRPHLVTLADQLAAAGVTGLPTWLQGGPGEATKLDARSES